MDLQLILGSAMVALAGFLSGGAAWPIKLMTKYRFEHWWFIAMIVGLVFVPWTVTVTSCPNAFAALAAIPLKPLLVANLWSAAWGVANVLCGLCYVRIGLSLTNALLAGLGFSTGAILPMIVKGSGIFHKSPDLASPAGLTVLAAVGLMLVATWLAALAGAGRERLQSRSKPTPGGFATALVMAAVAGIMTSGMSLSFVYGQEAVILAMKREGAGQIPAIFAAWAVCLLGGVIPCVTYPSLLMTRRKSWRVLRESPRELLLAAVIGVNHSASVALLGGGMLTLGSFGASVGVGIQQATWMLGGQIVGYLSGEWRSAAHETRLRIFSAIILLIVAILVMMYSHTLVEV